MGVRLNTMTVTLRRKQNSESAQIPFWRALFELLGQQKNKNKLFVKKIANFSRENWHKKRLEKLYFSYRQGRAKGLGLGGGGYKYPKKFKQMCEQQKVD